MARTLLALACATAISWGHSDRPRQPVPITVAIAGQGAIRVRIAAGVVLPCDSSDDEPVFDGWLEPGRYVFRTAALSVCMQHTYGPSRAGEWSSPVVLPTVTETRAWGRRPLEIVLSTERPYA